MGTSTMIARVGITATPMGIATTRVGIGDIGTSMAIETAVTRSNGTSTIHRK